MLWTKIKYKLYLVFLKTLLKLGFKNLLLKNKYGERILVFHGVDEVGNTSYNSRFVSKQYFETFIKYITTHYHVISLDDFYHKKFKKHTLNIALTFDDGYLNNYKYVIPILEKYNVPASFYITTIHHKASYLWADFLDIVTHYTNKKEVFFNEKLYRKNKKNQFVCNGISIKNTAKTLSYTDLKTLYEILKDDWASLPSKDVEDYWQLMNAEQIKEIADNPLFTIGAHGETHASLTNIPLEAAKKEIRYSKKVLDTICQKPINTFAFPFGFYNNELGTYCEHIGFKKILLVDYNTKADKKRTTYRNRFVMNPYISLDMQLVYLLKGSYL